MILSDSMYFIETPPEEPEKEIDSYFLQRRVEIIEQAIIKSLEVLSK